MTGLKVDPFLRFYLQTLLAQLERTDSLFVPLLTSHLGVIRQKILNT